MTRARKHVKASALGERVSVGEGEQILRVVAPCGSNLIEVRGEGGGWGEEGGVEEWRSYQAPQKAGALGERVSVGEGERVSVGEGERVSVGEGERVSEGEGERVSVGEGERVSVGEGEQIVRVVASHGSNLIERWSNPIEVEQPHRGGATPLRWSNPIELEDGSGTAMLCMLPAKFHRMLWLKRGSFVVADVSAAEEVDKAGGRVRGSITAVLFDHHIKELVASNQWPEAFAEAVVKERAGASAAAPLEQSQQEPQKQGAERSSAGEEGQGLRSSRGGAEEGREESTQRTRGDGQEKEEGVGEEEEGDDEEDDGLPPLERNPNHRPMFVEEDGSDEDSEEE
ncbi:unnamed protein product [Closterium sp. NIES-64]|nr:unnamed protein product [Closterium sp. NIES-64]